MYEQNSWPYILANQVLNRVTAKNKNIAIFECGFGPSGLPHFGTCAEVIRTKMIQKAFHEISNLESKVILFADDLDALRKIPENIPGQDILKNYIGFPVCDVPNVFDSDAKSYAEHNIQELIRFLKILNLEIGKDYEIMRASEQYRSHKFDNTLKLFAKHANEITNIVTKDYGNKGGKGSENGKNRKETYCPFLPIINGKTIFDLYNWEINEVGSDYILKFELDEIQYSINILECKLQWKCDWAMRQIALDVDCELNGKDLISSVEVGNEIMNYFNHDCPIRMTYELFLNEFGEKISKSKNNSSISTEEFLNYAPLEALKWFLYQNPNKARKLYWEIIPITVDCYLKELENKSENKNAIWFIHSDNLPKTLVNYNMLLNLVSIANTTDINILMRYLEGYYPNINLKDYPILTNMLNGAIQYYKNFILPKKEFRVPNNQEKNCLEDLKNTLINLENKDLRIEIFNCGKRHYDETKLRDFFSMFYSVIMGQQSGPQLHKFIEVIGLQNAIKSINEKIY